LVAKNKLLLDILDLAVAYVQMPEAVLIGHKREGRSIKTSEMNEKQSSRMDVNASSRCCNTGSLGMGIKLRAL
jgi:hypothetical protein